LREIVQRLRRIGRRRLMQYDVGAIDPVAVAAHTDLAGWKGQPQPFAHHRIARVGDQLPRQRAACRYERRHAAVGAKLYAAGWCAGRIR